jgi:hypothetical protein
MNIDEILKISAAIIASLGGGVLLVAVSANWLGGIWAKRMLQNERVKHSEALESVKKELDLIKQKELSRHFDKLSIYKDVVHIVSELLRELEAVTTSKQDVINPDIEHAFALNRNKAYGYIVLVSSQEVMDSYNEMVDFFIPIIYEGKKGTWTEMRSKADAMLNAMRIDLGIQERRVVYRGVR